MVLRPESDLKSNLVVKKMGERKVLNVYIPADFDPSLLPRMKRDGNKLHEIRMMLPFSLRCNTCGEYMYRGKKFNSKKEMIKGEDYLGIRKFRVIIKCVVCSAEITFKTDPKNSDYECESGASRNFETWRDSEQEIEQAKKQREEEDKMDAMKSLENRTLDNKLEMDVLDALDEIKSINQRHLRIDPKELISSFHSNEQQVGMPQIDLGTIDYDKIDNEILKQVNFKSSSNSRLNRRLEDIDQESEAKKLSSSQDQLLKSMRKQFQENQLPELKHETVSILIKKKRKHETQDADSRKPKEPVVSSQQAANSLTSESLNHPQALSTNAPSQIVTSLFADYGSEEEEEEEEEENITK